MKLPALLPIQAMKLPALPTIQAMKLPALPATPPPQDQMILMSMALVYLLSLPSVFCVFFAYLKNKKKDNEKKDQPPKRRHML